jgi:hypothetical protein
MAMQSFSIPALGFFKKTIMGIEFAKYPIIKSGLR